MKQGELVNQLIERVLLLFPEWHERTYELTLLQFIEQSGQVAIVCQLGFLNDVTSGHAFAYCAQGIDNRYVIVSLLEQ